MGQYGKLEGQLFYSLFTITTKYRHSAGCLFNMVAFCLMYLLAGISNNIVPLSVQCTPSAPSVPRPVVINQAIKCQNLFSQHLRLYGVFHKGEQSM